jgi:hypothetical protein
MLMIRKWFCIKERHNPQFKQPYYVLLGEQTNTKIKKYESPLYGYNNILKFTNERDYLNKIEELKTNGAEIR